MKILKFKAWNRFENKMYLSPSDIRHLGSWFDSHLPGSLSDTDNIVIMQFTGLTDRNGVEIYDGDVVKVIHEEGISWKQTKTDIGFVDFLKAAFSIKCIHPGKANAKIIENRYFFLHFSDRRIFEVIGNIYQNPELI